MINRSLVLVYTIVLTFNLTSCEYKVGNEIVNLNSYPREELSFKDLPDTIQWIYSNPKILEKDSDTVIVIENNLKINLNNISFNQNPKEFIFKGHIHEFITNGKITYSLEANQGDPFIFYRNYFFYSKELMLNLRNYSTSKYYRIKID
ncbi:hypothetical protein ACJD0Z_04115 [Flavobacteriaceae bacterium M23B6Z8]